MDTVTNHIRKHILTNLGVIESQKVPPMESLYLTEWCEDFEQKMRKRLGGFWCDGFIELMHNRLIMGRFRYGALRMKHGKKFDRLGSLERRVALYKKTGNAEVLVDIANIALVEYVEGNHELFHFSAQDDGIHDEEIKP